MKKITELFLSAFAGDATERVANKGLAPKMLMTEGTRERYEREILKVKTQRDLIGDTCQEPELV